MDPHQAICDFENFETLLRLARSRAVPSFETQDARCLGLLLACHQGLDQPADQMEGLYRRMEQLLCYAAPASRWESEFLPARLRGYQTGWLDTLMQAGGLHWVGSEGQRIAFCFSVDLDLMLTTGETEQVAGLEGEARHDFWALLRRTGLNASDLAERLWAGVWRGKITNDSFVSLRQWIDNGFEVPDVADMVAGHQRRSRAGYARWQAAVPFGGSWLRLPDRRR